MDDMIKFFDTSAIRTIHESIFKPSLVASIGDTIWLHDCENADHPTAIVRKIHAYTVTDVTKSIYQDGSVSICVSVKPFKYKS